MQNILSEIIANKRQEIEQRQELLAMKKLEEMAFPADRSFLSALANGKLNVIAEIKPQSPSAGILQASLNLDDILPVYNKYASAISVLTDEKYFGGSFQLLETVEEQTHLPLLCKDFILHPYQCYLARQCGAQAVLLIVKILSDGDLFALYQTIDELGMLAVIEVQNRVELERAMTLNPDVILINNRNLEDFKIDFATTKNLAPLIPKWTITISASGVNAKSDIEELISYCNNFLVGSKFMRAKNLEDDFRELMSVESGPQIFGR